MCLRHYEKIWIDASAFFNKAAKEAEQRGDVNKAEHHCRSVTDYYKAATLVMPKSLLLNFAYADFLESRGGEEAGDAKAVYEKLIENAAGEDVTLVYIQYVSAANPPAQLKRCMWWLCVCWEGRVSRAVLRWRTLVKAACTAA